jgi:undecaprenyl-diphosphatase
MAGASLLRLARFWLGGGRMTATEGLVLLVGCGGAFLVSLVALEFLVAFVRERSFRAFGWYRIALGAAVLLYFKG